VDSVEAGLAALRCPGVSSVQFTLSLLEQRGATELFPQALAQGVGGIAREVLANGLLAKPAADIDLQKYCNSPEEVTLRASQLATLRTDGADPLRRALDFPRSVDGVSVTLLGARNWDQLQKLLTTAQV
jgi:aryl-alcohol dehydrogenase-like predicted oxidoreductase